jgi:hypothetical protein
VWEHLAVDGEVVASEICARCGGLACFLFFFFNADRIFVGFTERDDLVDFEQCASIERIRPEPDATDV